MGIEVQPLATWTKQNDEASADIEAGMGVSVGGVKATASADVEGVCKFETAAGDQCTLEHGEILVSVTGTGSALGALKISSTAGVFEETATGTDLVNGYALEAWTAPGIIKAFIYPTARKLA